MRAFRRLLIAFFVLCLALVAVHAGSTLSVPTGTWQPVGSMTTMRAGAASVLLYDGRIMIIGGTDASGSPLATTEFFKPDGTFESGPAMNTPRTGHAAIWLLNGEVLVTGGVTTGGGVTNVVETFDPLTNQWTTLPALLGDARSGHTMAQLADGSVLVVGGDNAGTPITSLETYSLITESFSHAGAMPAPRKDVAAAALPDGRVLIAGGASLDSNPVALASTLIYDPATGAVTDGPAMSTARVRATATATYDGVAVVGGNDGTNDLGSADIYSAWSNTFRTVSGATPRSGHVAVLLPNNGSVLVTGGTGGTAVDLLQPWRNNKAGLFLAANASPSNHDGGFVAPTGVTGLMLAAGGKGEAATSADLYAFPTIATDKSDYAPGTTVVMTGSGFQAGETVTLHLAEWVNQTVTTYPDVNVTADGNGGFSYNGYAPIPSDLNSRYHLTAVGQSSGYQAQTVFSDSNNINSILTLTGPTPTTVNPGDPLTWSANACNKGTGNTCVTPAPPSTYAVSLTEYASNTCSGQSVGVPSTALTSTVGQTSSSTGSVTFSAPSSAGTHYYRAEHSTQTIGTDKWTSAQSSCVGVTVNANVATTTSVSSSANPSAYGQLVTFVATVAPITGSNTPAGSVQFKIDGSNFGSPVSLTASGSNGIATSASTTTLDVTGSPHTIAAVYTHSGNFVDSTGALSGGQTVTKANQTITFGTLPSKTYGDADFTVSATGGDSGNAVTFAATGNCSVLNANTIHITGAGSCTVTASQAGNTNYNAAADVAEPFSIAKANATVVVTPYSVTYDGNAHTATVASITGVNGESGATVGTVDVSKTSHTNAGDYPSDPWSFTGGSNYNDASGTVHDAIAKANATISVTAYSVTYDGSAHTATVASITGVNGESGATVGTVDVSKTRHTDAGTYSTDSWSFTGTNYNDIAATTITDSIAKANAAVVVTPYSVTYDGQAHTATVTSISGVNGETGATVGTVDVSHTNHTNAGTYGSDSWSFIGTANYNDIAATTIIDSIAKANQTISFPVFGSGVIGQSFNLAATAASGLNVTFSSLTPATCSVGGSTVKLLLPGQCNVAANQAGDNNWLAATQVTQSTVAGVSWSYFLQPINADGSSLFKLGSTLPVKFQLTGYSAGIANVTAKLAVVKASDYVAGDILESTVVGNGDTGNTFRYDSTAGQYIFNYGTKALSQGTWYLVVQFCDGQTGAMISSTGFPLVGSTTTAVTVSTKK